VRIKATFKIILHITFWLVLISILNSKTLEFEWGPFARERNTFIIPLIYGMAINLLLFYANVYWLIPVLFHKQKQKQFWLISISSLTFLTILELTADIFYLTYISKLDSGLIIDNYEDLPKGELKFDFVIWLMSIFIINAFYWALAFLYRFPNDWRRNERVKQQLIQDKLTAELDFLRAQINPHFLFNGINSIYHLIGSDDEEARRVLLQFSELLRYQLYECDDEYISLKNELNYIKNYIFLEKIRKGQDADIEVQLPGNDILESLHGLKIAPLLLTPFLENTFKYLSNHTEKKENRLRIQISVINDELIFFAENTVDTFAAKKNKNKKASGIGLENVKRRLNMLYNEKQQLNISQDKNRYRVSLKIKLS
jgi:two-component system, LytTR family, sensor kinase